MNDPPGDFQAEGARSLLIAFQIAIVAVDQLIRLVTFHSRHAVAGEMAPNEGIAHRQTRALTRCQLTPCARLREINGVKVPFRFALDHWVGGHEGLR
jgi:hypothetical protein